MACELWREKLDAYADGELPREQTRAFDTHLRACASCAAEVLARVQWKRAMQLAGKRYSPRAEFRERIAEQVSARKKLTWQRAWLPKFALAAIVLLAAFAAINRLSNSRQEDIFGELADLHVAALASANPVDVISTDRHTVKPWFEGKLPFSVEVPDLSDSPFILLGGRVTYMKGSAGAGLLFQFRKHRISVFIFQDRPGWEHLNTEGPSRRNSFTVESWSEGGLRYFVLSDAEAGAIRQLSELMQKAARP